MANRKLKAESRQQSGSAYSGKIRREGLIPAVVYGHNKETVSINVNNKELVKLLQTSGTNSVVGLELGEEVLASIVKEVQYHPINDEILHVDFQRLEENEKIKLTIPIVFDNMEMLQGTTAVITHPLDELEIQCMPRHIPKHSVHIDVKTLHAGNIVHVKDLPIFSDETIDILNDGDEIIASLSEVKEMKIEEEVEEQPIYKSEESILK